MWAYTGWLNQGNLLSESEKIVRFPELPAFQKLTTYWRPFHEVPHTLAGGLNPGSAYVNLGS